MTQVGQTNETDYCNLGGKIIKNNKKNSKKKNKVSLVPLGLDLCFGWLCSFGEKKLWAFLLLSKCSTIEPQLTNSCFYWNSINFITIINTMITKYKINILLIVRRRPNK